MSSSVNLVSSSSFQSLANPRAKIIMGCLCQKISDLFTNRILDKTVHPLEFAKDLLKSKKEKTEEETKTALRVGKYGSVIDEKTGQLFASLLHKLPESPIEEGLIYIKNAPGYDPIKGFEIPNDWEKTKTVTLNQIYKEQFFAWILKNSELSFSSILLMLQILESFDNPSIKLDGQVWNKALLDEKRQAQFKEFQSKYEFLIENKFLQSFPIELEKVTTARDIQKPIRNQYELFEKTFKWLIDQLLEDVQASNNIQASADGQLLKNALENLPEKDLSKKILTYKLKKVLPFLQEKFSSLIEYSNQQMQMIEKEKERLKELEETQMEVDKVLDICKEKKEQISSKNGQSTAKDKRKRGRNQQGKAGFSIEKVNKDVIELYHKLTSEGVNALERDTQCNEKVHKILKEDMTTLEHVEETEKYFAAQNGSIEKEKLEIQQRLPGVLHLSKEDFFRIHFLISHMIDGIIREQAQSKGERLNLSTDQFDKLLEKEFEAERKIFAYKAPKNQQKPLDFSDEEETISSDEEEPVNLSEPVSPFTTAPLYTGKQIQSYLSNKAKDKQLNGCLSQSAESFLQQIQPHLYGKQGKEVYDHVLLIPAALEQMAQAMCEGRIDDAVLGFRSSLLHCHFAAEQMLSQKIFQKTGKIADSHSLTLLANMLEASTQKLFSKEDKEFLEEIRVHLWFHYPEDYRSYFAHHNTIPKAFSLLETLSQPEISKENVQEAMEFAFEKYYQSLEFITKLSEAPTQNAIELFKSDVRDLQKHLNAVLGALKPRKLPVIKSSLTHKMDQVLRMFTSLDQLIHIKDLEDGWLLATFDTIKRCLQFMKSSLETPQEATKHSLQKFIQVETLLNMEKLFEKLFRAISFLHLGKDTRMHSLNKFYATIQEFYQEPLSKENRSLLRSINLSTTHHYFHKKSYADLKSAYSNFLEEARALSSVNEEFPHVAARSGNISAIDLQKKMEKDGQIMQAMDKSLDLFIKLLDPVINEIKKINNDIENDLNKLKIG